MSDNLVKACAELNLSEIAKGNIPVDDGKEQVKYQLNLFLIAQAQRELKRVVRLMDTLDKLQDRYEVLLDDKMLEDSDDELSINLPMAIETITKCLETSNSIISKVVGNEKIMNFQILAADNNSTINIGNVQKVNEVCNLTDPESRKRVRSVVDDVLRYVQSQNQNVGGESDDLQG